LDKVKVTQLPLPRCPQGCCLVQGRRHSGGGVPHGTGG